MCQLWYQIYTIIWCLIGLSMFPVAIWCLYRQIRQQKRNATPCILYASIIAFYICTTLCSFATLLIKIGWCTSDNFASIGLLGYNLYGLSWGFQSLFLIVILFTRLYYSFLGSSYALSKCATYTWISIFIIFILSLICNVLSSLTTGTGSPSWILTFGLLFVSMITLSIYLSVLFIYKLYAVNKAVLLSKSCSQLRRVASTSTTVASKTASKTNSGSDEKNSGKTGKIKKENKTKKDKHMLLVITKSTILATISIFSTLFMVIMTLVLASIDISSDINSVIFGALVLLDVITNFLCIMLSSNYAQKYYLILCGCLDNCCRNCCIKMHSEHDNKPTTIENELSSYVESTTQQTVQTADV